MLPLLPAPRGLAPPAPFREEEHLPWTHQERTASIAGCRGRIRGSLAEWRQSGAVRVQSRIRGKPSCPLRAGAAVTWREETRSAGRAKRSLEVIACTARLNESAYPREEKSAVWQLRSRDESSTSSRKRFALDQIVGNRRKLRSRFNSRTLPQTTETRSVSQRGRTSENITDFSVAFPPLWSRCNECSRYARFLLLKPCESLPENASLCTKNAA
jgi:hypothetical protein